MFRPLCKYVIWIGSLLATQQPLLGQEVTIEQIKKRIATYKEDARGTYESIRWFCKDGSVRMPKDPCPDAIGGIQHATYKPEVVALGKSNHVFLGQILAHTDKQEFWDGTKAQSRLKQYQMGRYLMRVDDGWVNRKGQYYRGAIQIEDEQEWGIAFYKWLLARDENLRQHYYLIMQSLKDIPHKGDYDLSLLVRAQSKAISDQYRPFMDIRIKIHSDPQPEDIDRTIAFARAHKDQLSVAQNKKINELIETMGKFHQPVSFQHLEKKINALSGSNALKPDLKHFITTNTGSGSTRQIAGAAANSLLKIRTNISREKQAAQRLALLDIASQLETMLFQLAQQWETSTLSELMEKNYVLSKAAAGIGLVELWEWKAIAPILEPTTGNTRKLYQLTETMEAARSVLEWSTGTANAVYGNVVNTYAKFEPLAYGFIDDRIRSSIALHLGKSVGELGAVIARESQLSNKVLQLDNQSTIRGLNPGYAFGELVVVEGNPEDLEVSGKKIYVFDRAPSDLKPVAGIGTVSEGNLVSHVQLLARNLGIPNVALSRENLEDLKRYHGKKVFIAVSNMGNVILKLEKDMSQIETRLFAVKERKEERITVPVSDLKLDRDRILDLRAVNAGDSGELCGPKAANLGQLKALYPEMVVEGFVVPFGIFKKHMLQPMPCQKGSYWAFLNAMFREAEKQRKNGVAETEVEAYQLQQLEILREAIKKMPLSQDFIEDIQKSFQNIFGKPLGSVPVFLRSDTNMEDLKDFTGAGLNLTLFNVLEKERILQGIKDVWASPYTERSFKWRQKYLLNPENVYPSILVIPSVDVDYSGVLITKGVVSGNDRELTIAFSRGAGGAVDGQVAESYILKAEGGQKLAAPAREPQYKTLPTSGGTGTGIASFETPILNAGNLKDIRDLASSIKKRFAKETRSDYQGAYDVELGFKDNKLWLFQIRPFVENKKALGSDYLESITPKIDKNKDIPLTKKI
ncbi:PEP/pyruvate-binding domain-containing protein [Flagellimonas nanhaiensis]|uniref:Phosphoenolpyruvate synthase n=1 Tax=Flagellimonas nanhaiensis TaxID=2292706 RepID=A0A371JN07_9FLAO|nr:PEP/pyruvate-binding domain-containing protein [Allomuricauda nanhaiensis]RDY58622.1 phosphoenolpyruvate synthase [Allomuricauda nanhaiensis]